MDPQAPSSPSSPSSSSPPPPPAPASSDLGGQAHGHAASPTSSDAPQGPSSQSMQSTPPPVPQPAVEGAPAGGGRHPRAKRKRTTARDKDILEEEFRKNSKPDKEARAEIVKRVSLTEKEVQIWFQNRRQNARRKARPLSPEDLAAIAYGPVKLLPGSSVEPANYASAPVPCLPPPEQTGAFGSHSDPASSLSSSEAEKADERPQWGRPWELPAPAGQRAGESQQPISRSFAGEVGYLANRRNRTSPSPASSTPSHLGRDDSFRSEPFPSCSPPSAASPALPTPPSSLRLSTSLEGKAEVVPSTFSSPPHPTGASRPSDALYRPEPLPRLDLQPSRGTITLPPISTLTDSLPPPPATSEPLPPRLTRGRSRDPQAWEYCCLSKNREDTLTMQAKHESSGSAVAEIHLIRSTSLTAGTSARQSTDVKRKTAAAHHGLSRRDVAKKPRLSRSASSQARIETTLGPSSRHNIMRETPAVSRLDKTKTDTEAALAGNDSDKENWSPDENGNSRPFRRVPSGSGSLSRRSLPSGPTTVAKINRRRSLHEGRSSPFLSSRAHTAPTNGFQHRRRERAQSPLQIYEDAEDCSPESDKVPDDEVERFMRGDVSPSKKGDADAVASLLSLSQGKWR
ncbi:6a0a8582-ff90-4145-9f8a-8addb3f21c3a [Thermothielavioides terrestris]|uniref:Homeobox domain-containing protein n=2 Tax=Thermothielavioides terrestris TaxID=2587410 RepID=G2RE45_THETT|nr:uncharacterized protein THITE_2131584 [Thermothielavioides terrestris NRRL 8126]AEO70072.1 hypothetical protein THITE_2131584 [Thermothielavioides terrestris NRRL 8126]SPQ17871.1 6a0a8582-ff90-4145-9f8a-8addb3f21c3a [Thermothielavioides terrestris]